MKTLIKDCYVWQWSKETIENLKKNKFDHFDGEFTKKDFLINENKKIILNFDIENEKIDNVISLKDKYCLPGFIDPHIHLACTALFDTLCDLSVCKGTEDVIKTLQKFDEQKEKEKEKEKGKNKTISCDEDNVHVPFLVGVGYKSFNEEENKNSENHNTTKLKLDRFILDKYFPDKCVVVLSTCIHYAILNSKAIKHFGFLSYEKEKDLDINVGYYNEIKEDSMKEDAEKMTNGIVAEKKNRKILSGVFYEQIAQDLYDRMLNESNSEVIQLKYLKNEISKLVKTGLTCVQTCDQNKGYIYKKLENQNELNIRTFLVEYSMSIFEYLFNHYKINKKNKSNMELYRELLQKLENDKHRKEVEKLLKAHFFLNNENENVENEGIHQRNKLFYGNRIKFFCDGSLGGKTCATYYPFRCNDAQINISQTHKNEEKIKTENNYGILIEPLTLSYRIRISKLLNFRIEFHCIGDRSADFLLNELQNIDKNPDRYVLVHAQLLNENVIEKLKNVGILLSLQPSFISSDFQYIQHYIHTSYKKYAYLYKSLLNKNIVIAGSSDSPVELYAPLIGMFDCMFRSVTKVLPLSYIESFYTGEKFVDKQKELENNLKNIKSIINNCYAENERLSFPEALALYTITPAYIAKAEFFNEANKIKLGAIYDNAEADFVIIDRDISKDCEINLLSCRIYQTWVGGEIRYQNDKIDL